MAFDDLERPCAKGTPVSIAQSVTARTLVAKDVSLKLSKLSPNSLEFPILYSLTVK